MAGLEQDVKGNKLQGFAPGRIVEITAAAAWTPGPYDVAFRNGVATAYFMDAVSAREASLTAGSITVISKGVTSYTFDTTMELEVM